MLDLPIKRVSPFSGRTTEGSADSGALSEIDDCVRCRLGRAWTCGGEEDRIPVVEVGIGVGYFSLVASRSEGEDRA